MVEEPPGLALKIMASHPGLNEWISWAPTQFPLSRKGAIRCLTSQMARGDVSVSLLGGNCPENYMIRKKTNQSIARNFFCIGAIGHVPTLSYGVMMGVTLVGSFALTENDSSSCIWKYCAFGRHFIFKHHPHCHL